MPLHHRLKAISVTWSPLSWFLGCLLSCQKSTDIESWHQVRLLWQQLRMRGVPWAVQEECGSLQKAGKTPAHWAILTLTLKTPSKPIREGTPRSALSQQKQSLFPLKQDGGWPDCSHPCFTKLAPAQVNIQGKVTEDTG